MRIGSIKLSFRLRMGLSLLFLLTGIITVFSGAILLKEVPQLSASAGILSVVLFYIGTGLCWVLAAGILLGRDMQ